MGDSFIQLPDDTGNTGKKVRTVTRVTGSDTVHEHVFLVVRPVSFSQYALASVSPTTETVVLTHVVTSDRVIKGFYASGSTSFRFQLKIDGVVNLVARSTPANRDVNPFLGDGGFLTTVGQTITITAYHEETIDQMVDITLFGLVSI